MVKTGLNLKVAFSVLICFSTSYLAYSKGLKQSLIWKPVVSMAAPDGRTQSFLIFEGAQYPGMPSNPLPYWTATVDLKSKEFRTVNTLIGSPVYAPLTSDESALILSYSSSILQTISGSIVPISKCAEIKKEYQALISFVPLRKNNSGEYEKLVSFELIVTSVPAPFANGRVSSSSFSWASSSVLATGNWYKIGVTQDAVYKLDYNQLSALGLDMNGLDPQTVRVYGNGGGQLPYLNSAFRRDDLTENAVFVVDGGTPNLFEVGDYILFYGMSPHRWFYDTTICGKFKHQTHVYSDTTYYFITSDLGPGKKITPRVSDPNPQTNTVTTFDDHAFHEQDATNLIKSGREWFGEYFDITNSYSFAFSFPNIDLSSPVNYTVDIMGRSHVSSGDYTVSSGSTSMSLFPTGTDMNYYASIYAYPAKACTSYIPASSNILVTITKNSPSPSVGWVNYIDVTARRQLQFAGPQMSFRDANSVGPGNISQFNLTNANSSIVVWDVTDPVNVVQQGATLNGNQLEFRVLNDTLREFISFNGLSFNTPYNVGLVPNQNLHASAQVDYIIVVHPDFMSDAQKLAALHATRNNLSSVIVTPMQIYNEFSSGAQDVTAIRDFIRMFYERSTGPADAPRYLLLYGDGSYDNKLRLSNNTNFIPTYQSLNSNDPIRSYVSDDYFVQLGPTEGVWAPGDADKPDLGVGRFPVKSLGESNNVYAKIENYGSVPGSVNLGNQTTCASNACTTFGDWRNMISFVGDDEDGNQHALFSDLIANYVDTAYNNYNVEKIYLDASPQVSTPGGNRYPDVVAAINKRMEKGALIFNYIGHGGEVGLAHERIIEVNQINNWSNGCNLPLFFTATCEFSRWDDPGRTSAGEYVLLNGSGGGIGLFTTVRLVFSGPNFSLNNNFFKYALDTMSNGEIPALGDLNMLTKSTLVPDDNHRNFTLLCDPALQLAYPKHRIQTNTINLTPVIPAQPDTLKALSRVTVTGEIRDLIGNMLNTFNGIIYPTVYDKTSLITCLGNDPASLPAYSFYVQKNVLYKGKASVVNGNFTFSFIVPKDIAYQYGKGRLSYYAHNGFEDASGYNEDFLIGGSDSNAPADLVGPQTSLYMNDESFVSGGITDENPEIYAVVFDTNGINTVGTGIGHDLTAILDLNSSNPIILNDYYEANLNSYSRGTIRYPLSDLSSGNHSISVKVWDVYNNSSTDYTEFVVAESAILALDHVLNYPNPFSTKTAFYFEHNKPCSNLDVQIQIFTVSGKLVKTINTDVQCDGYRSQGIDWDGMDDFGDAIGRGVYFYRLKVRTTEGEVADEYSKLVILK